MEVWLKNCQMAKQYWGIHMLVASKSPEKIMTKSLRRGVTRILHSNGFRMIGLLRFDETNGNVPWTLVGFIRKLESGEEFPLLSPECLISDSVRRDDAIRKASHDDPQTYKKGPHHQYRSH
ncbi:hypothetical protein GCK32_000068 [Trichostrongylus colubriformis]|uniref:Uncharacterized protein n=1 Tax=Trichostrongylus colubriformis TaxID=6319 RepID=A0AAN8ISI2_TRICO